jgi:dolichol-phosphate mannosyltransferase
MLPPTTIIVPTYREVLSIPHLVERIRALRESTAADIDLLLMDDDSKDGSEELVSSLALPWVTLVKRTTDRGLSQAVLDGLKRATKEFLVVMDADLSHPPESIPAMIEGLQSGAEVVIGSRFVDGGSTADDWGVLRWLNSRVATLMCFPLTRLRDPMSGFFAIRRSTVIAGRDLDPIGYKILLELIIKCRCNSVAEVPIHFDNRRHGQSKLTLKVQLQFLKHLRRLYIYKFGTWSHLAQFLFVGLSGLVVNLAVLTLLLYEGVNDKLAVALAIAVSMVTNFVLNRRFSFSYARGGSIFKQFLGFVAACSIGALVNYLVTLWQLPSHQQLAAIEGVLAGTLFNFVANRFLVFRAEHFQVSKPPTKE